MTVPGRQAARTAVLSAALAAAGGGVVACGGDARSPAAVDAAGPEAADHEYVVPAGTGARLDAGEAVALMPDQLDVHVGETLRIVNEDSRGYVIGPFYVGAGETVTQRFTTPGTFEGECAVHPGGRMVLRVTDDGGS